MRRILGITTFVFILTTIFSLGYNIFIAKRGIHIGFPFEFFLMFKCRGNEYFNRYFNRENFLLDYLIVFAIVFIINKYVSPFIKSRKNL